MLRPNRFFVLLTIIFITTILLAACATPTAEPPVARGTSSRRTR